MHRVFAYLSSFSLSHRLQTQASNTHTFRTVRIHMLTLLIAVTSLSSSIYAKTGRIDNFCNRHYESIEPLTALFPGGSNNAYVSHIKGGVPFKKDQLSQLSQLAVVDKNCNALNFQVEALTHWPNGSIKAVKTELPNQSVDQYYLAIKPKGSLANNPSSNSTQTYSNVANGIKINETSSTILLSTESLTYRIPKNEFNLIGQVSSSDPKSANAPSLLVGGDIYMVNAFDNKTYLASNSKPKVSIEHAGPLTTTIKTEGTLTNSDGDTLTDYLLRSKVYANTNYVDIDFTVIDRRPEENVRAKRKTLALSVSDYGITFVHKLSPEKFYFGGETGSKSMVSGAMSGNHKLVQLGKMNHINGRAGDDSTPFFEFQFEGDATGTKAQGWGGMTGNDQAVALMIKGFWEQFPNKLDMNKSTITASFHPIESLKGAKPDISQPSYADHAPNYVRPNTFYFRREGGAKTYQMRLFLIPKHSKTQTKWEPKAIQAHNDDYQKNQLNLKVSPEWYSNSGVFGDITPANKASKEYDHHLYNDYYLPSTTRGTLTQLYGWRDYGDRMRPGWGLVRDGVKIPSFYNDTHVGSNQYFVHYLRTGQPEWYQMATIATRHFMDIDVSHTQRKGRRKINGRHAFYPAGEIHAFNHGNIDHETSTFHSGHAHISGLTNYYLLTGDRRAKDMIDEISNWWLFMVPKRYPLPKPEKFYTEAERDFGWPLYVMNELVKSSNNKELHQKASAHLVNFLIDWWKNPGNHEINGKTLGYHDYRKGTGWWRMTNMDNGKGSGTNPWMAGPLLTNLIEFSKLDSEYSSSANPLLVKEMLYQTMNYIVKYGWDPQPGTSPDEGIGHFVYSEAKRRKTNINHILYPLAYLYRSMQADLKANKIAHPEWYDTYPLWDAITQQHFKQMQKANGGGLFKGTHRFGFYGYETIYPIDYLTIMAESESK